MYAYERHPTEIFFFTVAENSFVAFKSVLVCVRLNAGFASFSSML